jgi:hypothetical protein
MDELAQLKNASLMWDLETVLLYYHMLPSLLLVSMDRFEMSLSLRLYLVIASVTSFHLGAKDLLLEPL